MLSSCLVDRANFWVYICSSYENTTGVLAYATFKSMQVQAYVASSEAGGSRYSKITESLNCEKGPAMTLASFKSSTVGSANLVAILPIYFLLVYARVCGSALSREWLAWMFL